MDDQIKQLAEQAGAEWDDKYHWYVGNEQMKKFAQLIVRECIRLCDQVDLKIEKASEDAFFYVNFC